MSDALNKRVLAREYYEAARALSDIARGVSPLAEREHLLAVAAWYGAEGARLETTGPARRK